MVAGGSSNGCLTCSALHASGLRYSATTGQIGLEQQAHTCQILHPQRTVVWQEWVAPLLLCLACGSAAQRERQASKCWREVGERCRQPFATAMTTTASWRSIQALPGPRWRSAPLASGGGFGLSRSLAATRSTNCRPPSGTSSAGEAGLACVAGGESTPANRRPLDFWRRHAAPATACSPPATCLCWSLSWWLPHPAALRHTAP